MWISHRKEIQKLTFRALALRRSESRNYGLCAVYIYQIDSMLPCTCPVIDHRCRQNFVRIKAALFHVRRAKVGPSPFWQTLSKPFDAIHDLYKMKQSHWLLCVGKNSIGLGKSRHCQTWLEFRFSWNKNLQRRKTWTSKTAILKEYVRKVESIFVIRSAQWAEKLGCCLEYCRSWKKRSENLRLRSTWCPFDLRFERTGALVTVEIWVLCGRWSSNQFEIVSKTPFSCDAVCRELLWAVLCSLLCPELDWNIRIGKQGYMFVWL